MRGIAFSRLHGVMLLAVLQLFACAVSASPTQPSAPPVVSMIELLANKEKYDGKSVQVSGFLSVRFEDDALYFDENAYLHMFTENAMWIEIDDADRAVFQEYDKHPGYVTGVFKTNDCNGHLCLYGGTILHAKPGLMFKER